MNPLPPGTDLCSVPAGTPPPGETYNLTNPYSLAPTMIAVSTVVTSWAFLFVVIRIWNNRRKLLAADYMIIFGIIWDIGFTSLILSQSRSARHQWNIPACWLNEAYLKVIFLISALFGFTGVCKAVILLMYLQIFSVSRRMRIAVWIGLVFDFIIYIPCIPIAVVYQAPHYGQTWDDVFLIETEYQTSVLAPWGIATGAASILLDSYIVILPLTILSILQLSLSKKIQVSLVFLTAFAGVAASAVALYYRVQLLGMEDRTWQNVNFQIAL
ncbi:hypothetical protein F4680DRAFT_469091 [Xylaria scruposa]|nr:hypothetical protein F4680DRAFT_469091 [Xylaria scruposa]